MKIGHPLALWVLALVPVLVIFYWWAFQRKKLLLDQFVAPHLREKLLLNFSPVAQQVKAILMLLAITLLILALARPQWGHRWEEVKRRGVDLLVAIDVSKSMLAQDVSPNRLERAKREVIDLMSMLQGDRLGLIAFAGTSFVQVPLTLDYGAVQIFMNDLDTGLIPIPGTALAHTIETAVKAFASGEKKSRVLILMTDGEDHKGGDPEQAAKKAAEQGVKIYTVGIGDPEGAPIPDEQGGFKKDRSGNLVLTKLNEEMLQKVALATGGSYVRSITGDLDLAKIYEDVKKTVEDKELQGGKRKHYEERYQWPLLLALLVLLVEIFLRERKRRVLPLATLLAMTLASSLLTAPSLQAVEWWKSPRERAESAYDRQDYQKAMEELVKLQVEDPKNLALTYNLANSYYQSKDYEKAAQLYSSVVQQGADAQLAFQAYYNLGNTAYRMGKLQEAVEYYQQALKLRPDDQDAQSNLVFVREEIKRRIEENKQQQEERQQQCNNPQQGQNKEEAGKKEEEGKQDSQKKDNENNENNEANKDNKDNKDNKEENAKEQPAPKEKQVQVGEQSEDKKKEEGRPPEQGVGAASEEGQGNAPQMDAQEVERWLNSLPDSRKEYLQKMMQQQRQYQSEKDW